MDERKTLGKNIQRYRLFRRIGAEQLGENVGLTKEHISRLETGDERAKNIGLDYLIKIAKELDVPMEELFMKNPEEVNIKFAFSEGNLEAFRKLLGRLEYTMQIKKKS